MNHFMLLEAAQSSEGGMPIYMTLLIYIPFFALLYFLFIRPQSKKKKKEAEMKKSAQVGDEITTIGGISGRIIASKDEIESVVLETGSDRSRLLIKRWAIGSVDTVHEDDE